jgi:hypothetical protein
LKNPQPKTLTVGSVELVINEAAHVVSARPSASADHRWGLNRFASFRSVESVQLALSQQVDRERRKLPYAADMVRALTLILKEYPHVF